MTSDPSATRRAWHGVAELVLAGPQYRRTGTIRLRVTPGGFATVAEPELRVDGVELVGEGRRFGLSGATPSGLAAAVGVDVGAPADLYADSSGVRPDDELVVDAAAAAVLGGALALGHDALRRIAPDANPVLWPEHFDVSITLDEVNYGVSLGDGYLAEPYAYVGPWRPRTGTFFNAPFGAARPLTDLGGTDEVVAFFVEGRERSGSL